MTDEGSLPRPVNVLVLPGDGVGPEVIRGARSILDLLARHLPLGMCEAPIGGASIDETGHPLSPEVLRQCLAADAVLLGAVGGPQWDHVPRERRPEAGLLALRREMGLFANIRPVRLSPATRNRSPLRPEVIGSGVDMIIIRELAGGLYYGPRGLEGDRAFDTLRYGRAEIQRVVRKGFEVARGRRGKLTSVDKANVLATSGLWRAVVTEMTPGYPGVEVEHLYVDSCAMQMVLRPESFDVLVTENTFGDILSDLGAALVGSIGMMPSASLGPGDGPGLYEPVHGSAPDIAGTATANPVGAILSVAMMMEDLGRADLARQVKGAVEEVLEAGWATADMAGPGVTAQSTDEMGRRIAEALAGRFADAEGPTERR